LCAILPVIARRSAGIGGVERAKSVLAAGSGGEHLVRLWSQVAEFYRALEQETGQVRALRQVLICGALTYACNACDEQSGRTG
jgi:hypothetical protein